MIKATEFSFVTRRINKELREATNRVIDSNWYILGKEVENFEREFANYLGVKYCIGVGNGLEALHIILRAYGIGEGDEVIIPSDTYIATALAVSYAGATPVMVEPDERTYNINPDLLEEKITKKIEMYPLGLGKPEDIANVCAFMLSDASRWITGTNLIIDGGYSAR